MVLYVPPLVGIISFRYSGTITLSHPTPHPPINLPIKMDIKFLGTYSTHPIVHTKLLNKRPPRRPICLTIRSENNVPIIAPPGTASTIAIFIAEFEV